MPAWFNRASAMISHNRFMRLLLATAGGWRSDHISRLAASLSFYALLSLIPLLLTFHGLMSLVMDRQLLAQGVDGQIAQLLGAEQARAIRAMLNHAQAPSLSSLQALVGSILTFITAGGVFIDLKDSMDAIWKRTQASSSPAWYRIIADYFAPMTMVLGFGFLLLVSLLLDALISYAASELSHWQPALLALVAVGNLVVGWILSAVLFAAIFRFLPASVVAWRDVWLGAALTATLFVIGRFAIGFYLGTSDFSGKYGAAGALVAVIVWIYYSAQILFIGAVFTREHARIIARQAGTADLSLRLAFLEGPMTRAGEERSQRTVDTR
jgi:membrane protein